MLSKTLVLSRYIYQIILKAMGDVFHLKMHDLSRQSICMGQHHTTLKSQIIT